MAEVKLISMAAPRTKVIALRTLLCLFWSVADLVSAQSPRLGAGNLVGKSCRVLNAAPRARSLNSDRGVAASGAHCGGQARGSGRQAARESECCPLAAVADDVGHWYLSPCVGGITPDKPWGGTGGAVLYEALQRRSRPVAGVQPQCGVCPVRVGRRRADPRRATGGKRTREPNGGHGSNRGWAPSPGSGRVPTDRRPRAAARHQGALDSRLAHAPGGPVDVLYVLGLTFSFGSGLPPAPR